MAWVRVDDGFYDHPKWHSATAEMVGLWVAAMAWCNRNDSVEGFIPTGKLAGLVAVRNLKSVCAALVASGAFHDADGGYLIHDYEEYQQNEKVQAIRAKRSEAGKKGATARWGNSKPAASGMANAIATECPDPGPDPVTSSIYEQTDRPNSAFGSSVVVSDALERYANWVTNKANVKTDRGRYFASVLRGATEERSDALFDYLDEHYGIDCDELAFQVLGVPRPVIGWQPNPDCPECSDGWHSFTDDTERTYLDACPMRLSGKSSSRSAEIIELRPA